MFVQKSEKGFNLNVHILANLVDRLSAEALEKNKCDADNTGYLILKIVAIHSPIDRNSISDIINLSRPVVDKYMKKFKKMGLVEVRIDASTKAHYYELTGKGFIKYSECYSIVNRKITNFVHDRISHEEKDAFMKILKKIIDSSLQIK